ncbi:olfactory receptor 1500-like [Pleuronectes platessa]|uniref:olfactory receptor 1500-like n=1 Tax=Pleuronectes platessa TaxID=8262 RepID=UPI00232A7284|nr:olfactory receptor 1500-like [Pleuronectes platessa]
MCRDAETAKNQIQAMGASRNETAVHRLPSHRVIFSVLANTAVMAVICLDPNLRTPKYIIVFNLAFTDLFSNSALVPNVFLFNHHLIPYNDCLTFLFFCYTCLSMQSLNLVALSYDRLIAIGYPLQYHVKITHRSMFCVIASFWLSIVTVVLIAAGLLTRLSFCQSVVIRSYFCDHGQLYRLACNDTTPSFIMSYLLPALILWFPLIFIVCTYLYISYALSKVTTVQGRLKALKTCTAHLSLVAIYFIPILVTFMLQKNIHPNDIP